MYVYTFRVCVFLNNLSQILHLNAGSVCASFVCALNARLLAETRPHILQVAVVS